MRHELKYVITPAQYILLKNRLRFFMQRDEHGGTDGNYFIRSIYFDSDRYDALHEKNKGILNRKKYRLRFYNGDTAVSRLECKRKSATRIEKLSVPITEEEMLCLLEADRHPKDYEPEGLAGELRGLIRSRGFKPTVVVDYLREAYVYPVSDLRITFDKEIAAGTVKDCMIKDRCMANVLPEGQMILEVKYNQYIPEHISHVVSSVWPTQTAASKYVMCVTQAIGGTIL
ncbi:MAG: polyphosphate polymerase domain-containing protein [Lachnoclostridium sp.]|nr:polyphosphate polymerase domain-containing protein [Lachnospira sp.]MCM1248508.1 polyphosphate polymerase domain-containing protein [Lachnoclostridium sp.]MCM1535330.1 polyphosphate polymerase domain-containing protein [Clostridium sp.]